MPTPELMTERMKVPEELAVIQRALAYLPSDCLKPWRSLDRLPYLHATDDPAASPWGTPVVGRFDYMETKDYIAACNPAAMANVLEHVAALQSALNDKEAEIERLKSAIRDYHYALDMRQHGGVALDRAFNAIRQALGMHWVQGEEKERRASIDAMKGDAS